MRLRHLGHSCVLVETSDGDGPRRVLVDPGNLSDASGVIGVDLVVVTHQHADHVDPDAVRGLLAGSPEAGVLAEPQAADLLGQAGIAAHPWAAGETREVGPLLLQAVGREHALVHADIPRVGNVGVVVRDRGAVPGGDVGSLFHPGDAHAVPPDELDVVRGVDVLAVPLCAPWAVLTTAVELVRTVQPARIAGIHDGFLNPAGRALFLRVLGMLCPDSPVLTLDRTAG
jgi:L-ascorbate metabolism protein UlaG (beta-lactamase superfamily)